MTTDVRSRGATLRRLGPALLVTWLLASGMAAAEAPGPAEGLHAPWDRIVAEFVDEHGRVAYRDLAARSGAQLEEYLQSLAEIDPSGWSQRDRIALWLNAYNAHAVNGILHGYSAEGIFARTQFFSWYDFRVARAQRTLGAIEHEILRVQFDEPRIHFALVCASTSCPKLRREAYRGDILDRQLDDQVRGFLADPSRNRFAPGGTLYMSRIFEWFAADFEKAAGSVVKFIARYRDVPAAPQVEYLDYDWTMNAQPGQRPF